MCTSSYIHYRYGIAFLVFTLVAVVAFAFYDIPELVGKVSFALTITSLVLAFVAIIYTFVVTNRQDYQLTQLVNASTSIILASQDIQRAATSFHDQAREIPMTLASLESKLGALVTTPREISPDTEKNQLPTYTVAQFRIFLANMRYAAMAALYLCVCAFKKNKPITRDMTETLGQPSFDVMIGVLAGIEASGLINFAFHQGELIATHCDQVVEENTGPFLQEILKLINQPEGQLNKMLSKIDALFE